MMIGSLCSGFGGLEIAVEALWPGAKVAWHSEVDPHAGEVLTTHWPDTPNLGDLTSVDWGSVAPIDVLTAGYPCQPFSTAGRRKGEDDARHLWPGVLRAVRDLRPRLVLLENVAGHLSLGFGRVLGDLAEAGYVGSWTCLRASDVGACHRRERVFIATHPADAGVERRYRWAPFGRAGWDPAVGGEACDHAQHGAAPLGAGATPPDADVEGRDREPELDRLAVACGEEGEHWRHADRCGVEVGRPFGQYQDAVDRWAGIIGRPAPPGLDGGRLNARFVEWMQGLEPGWVTDVVPRRHALRILGNGVVPQQATVAYRTLVEMM